MRKAGRMNEALMMDDVAQQASLENSYLNGQDDLLEIEVYTAEECNKTVRVKSIATSSQTSTNSSCGETSP
jgi:hypothetical protein